MRLGIVGGRDFADYDLLCMEAGRIPATIIVSGGAKGCDLLARRYAEAKSLKLVEFLPDYTKYGRGAPIRRNADIISNSDVVLAFWDGKSKGTKNSIDTARSMGKDVQVVVYKNKQSRDLFSDI